MTDVQNISEVALPSMTPILLNLYHINLAWLNITMFSGQPQLLIIGELTILIKWVGELDPSTSYLGRLAVCVFKKQSWNITLFILVPLLVASLCFVYDLYISIKSNMRSYRKILLLLVVDFLQLLLLNLKVVLKNKGAKNIAFLLLEIWDENL